MDVHAQLLDTYAPSTQPYLASVDEPTAQRFPQHFLASAFPRLGGRFVRLEGQGQRGYALVFPRGIAQGQRLVTARISGIAPVQQEAVTTALADLLAPDQVHVYAPPVDVGFVRPGQRHDTFQIGAPAANEVAAMRRLQAQIWQTNALYPDDVHSAAFAPATSLVVRQNDEVMAFLLGFFRFGSSELPGDTPDRLSIESQVMGIAPAFRRYGLAAALKRAQARQALAAGIDLIHWTADPLQFANAALNFGTLRAIAGEFLPGFYQMSNALNRVSASRLSISWLLRSTYGAQGMCTERRTRPTLADFPGVQLLNAGPTPLAVSSSDAPFLAIEIPADWTALQHDDLALAQRWRATTDALLAATLGYHVGRYVICDAATDGARRYLIARAFDDNLIVGRHSARLSLPKAFAAL
ncbi:GNAT family N-acetyltransferase [Candidatus Gracilibacteria bacterium]|nr:GNAT family N-acetyltransferase [Candidatus Gracilibacteria bacterium]